MSVSEEPEFELLRAALTLRIRGLNERANSSDYRTLPVSLLRSLRMDGTLY